MYLVRTVGSTGSPWVGWSNATVKASDMFALYPVWPTEYVTQASEETVLDTTRRSSKLYSDFPSGRPVEIFPAAVRAGYSSKEGTGWKPEEVLDGLAVSLKHLGCCDTNMLPCLLRRVYIHHQLPIFHVTLVFKSCVYIIHTSRSRYAPGGGVENVGISASPQAICCCVWRIGIF